MHLRIYIDKLIFSDSTEIDIEPGDVVVLVGPNNVGKTVALRDIRTLINNPNYGVPLVVKDVQLEREGDDHDLRDWLEEHASKAPQSEHEFRRRATARASYETLQQRWASQPPLWELGEMFMLFLDGESRLNLANGSTAVDFTVEVPELPLHHLYLSPQLERRMSEHCRRAFGVPLVLNRTSGSAIHLHVGDSPGEATIGQPVTDEYIEAINRLPVLEHQGDGVRAFMGLLLHTLVLENAFVLIDEPEAFLHPPQAYRVGKTLVDEKPDTTQLFLATHSSDVLRGVLDARDKSVRVVRLLRDNVTNHPSELDPSRVRELWSDPILRYSNILDGVFHQAVILCESDADCRFYFAVLNSLEEEEDLTRVEVMFTHCGGKARMPKVIQALRAVSAPVVVVGDFDVVREEQPLHAICDALDLPWDDVADDWRVVKASLDNEARPLTTDYLRQEFNNVINQAAGNTPTAEELQRLRELLRTVTGWEKIKRAGIHVVPHGEARERCDRLLDRLAEAGMRVVPVGELEGFAPDIGLHGPGWVNEVLERHLHEGNSLPEARDFVGGMRGWISERT